MQWDVPVIAWAAAALLCVLVLGYCAYELAGKARRLRRDVRRLQALDDELATLRAQLAAARQRAESAGLR